MVAPASSLCNKNLLTNGKLCCERHASFEFSTLKTCHPRLPDPVTFGEQKRLLFLRGFDRLLSPLSTNVCRVILHICAKLGLVGFYDLGFMRSGRAHLSHFFWDQILGTDFNG